MSAPRVVVFGKEDCGYCHRAKLHLDMIGAQPVYRDIGADPAARADLDQLAPGFTTVPQIFVAGRHIGGHDDLMRFTTKQLQEMYGGV